MFFDPPRRPRSRYRSKYPTAAVTILSFHTFSPSRSWVSLSDRQGSFCQRGVPPFSRGGNVHLGNFRSGERAGPGLLVPNAHTVGYFFWPLLSFFVYALDLPRKQPLLERGGGFFFSGLLGGALDPFSSLGSTPHSLHFNRMRSFDLQRALWAPRCFLPDFIGVSATSPLSPRRSHISP